MKHIRKISLFFTVGLIVTTFLLTTVEPLIGNASAVTTDPQGGGSTPVASSDSIEDQVKSYLYIRAIARCIKAAQLHDKENFYDSTAKRVDQGNASSFDWFRGGRIADDTDTWTGYLDPDHNDGKSSCHDINGGFMKDAYGIWQLGGASDGVTAICYSGFTREGDHNDQTPAECVRGTQNQFVRPNDDTSAASKEFITNVLAQYYGGGSLPSLSDPMKYWLYYNSVVKGCHATKRDNPDEYTDSEIANDPHLVRMLAADGTTVEVWQLGQDYTKDKSIIVSTLNSLDGPATMKCGDLAAAAVRYAPAYAQAGGADPNTNGETADLSCEAKGGSFGWILCGIVSGLQDLVGNLYDNVIQPLLYTEPLTTGDNPIYDAWKNFRIYGDIFLVIGILIIVFGESIGGGLIDAYTAKKVLPRLLIAAVLINLSFYVVAVLVDIMNVVGKGAMDLITAPFALTGDFTLDIGVGGGAGLVGILGAAFIYTIAGISGSFFAWLFFVVLIPMALIMLAILATVLVRHALLIFLVIISPVAFALYCLPNTEKYFRQWWDMLFKTLLVFPIIAALFAMGKVSAYLISNLNGNILTEGVGDVIAVIALFVPLLLIPFAFKIAGGVIGRAFDAVDGIRARGHKMGESRRAAASGRVARVREGRKAIAANAVINRNPVGRLAQRAPVVGKHIGSYASRAEQTLSTAAADMLRNNPNAATVANDEDALKTAMHGKHGFEAGVRGYTDELVAGGMDKGKAAAQARAGAQRWLATGMGFNESAGLAAFQMATQDGTVFKDQKQQHEYINSLAGQDESLRARIWGNAYAGNKGAGRHDLSPSYGTGKILADAMANGGRFKDGTTFMGVDRGGTEVTDLDFAMSTVEGARNTSNTELASRLKGKGMEDFSDSVVKVLRDGTDETFKAEVVAKVENLRDSGLYMPEALLSILNNKGAQHPVTADATIDVHADAATATSSPRIIGPDGKPLPPTPSQAYNEQRQVSRFDPRAPGGPLDPGAPSPPPPPGPGAP
jgi:hypothetical protein